MAVFDSCSVLFELKGLSFKEKKKVKSAVTDHGGNLSFVVNKQCSLVVTTDVSNLSSNRLRSIQKYHTPVVGVDYVYRCVERGVLLQVDEYKLDTSSASSGPLHRSSFKMAPLASLAPQQIGSKGQAQPMECVSGTQRAESLERSGNVLDRFRIYRETDSDLPSDQSDFQVAKYSIFEKVNSNSWCVLELQSFKGEEGRQYRVVRYWKDDVLCEKKAVRDKLVFLSTSEEALEVFQALRDSLEASGLRKQSRFPPSAREMGSAPLQQLLLEEKLNTGSLSQEVGVFVELLWTEALGCLDNILRVSVDKLSLNDVSRAEGLLLQAQKKLTEGNHAEPISLLQEFYTLLPHRQSSMFPSTKLISQKLDLCQLIRDVLNASEMTLRSPAPSTVGKYRALRCSVETVPPSSSEFQAVTDLLQDSRVQIQQIVRVGRGVELQTFKSELENVKPLLHSSSPNNFVGILSRGLLLPHVGVEHHGIERTDFGKLGGGIYFSDSLSTSLKYSKPSVTDGSRLLLVCDVALGRCREVYKTDILLKQAPDGYDSVRGVRRTPNTPSEFEDDEYVVYSPDQVKLKYVVQFSIQGDQLKDFTPSMNMSPELCLPCSAEELSLGDDMFESSKNPLEEVTAGLLDSTGQQLPLQAVHVKCKLMDLLSQVIIFQKYTNLSSVPIEAKYVFPLDDSAAVCGFEAFINGKHVVGQVKEKEKARKEYKQAIEKGHGAYLMDQDAPDVFTISVGNLPPGATVLIKVTFVSELIVRDGTILFSLPGSVAPWQESAALNQTTQVTVEKVCVTDEAASVREFTLDLSAEMPYEISSLQCITHQIKMKKTDCKAVVSVLPGQIMGPDGFQLSIMLSDVHLPRMWVEKHPDKDSQACMLVFYPDFEVSSSSDADEVILLLDTSESMKGESLRSARRIALQILKSLDRSLRLNVVLFGTDHTEAFLTVMPLGEVYEEAQRFIKQHSAPLGGGTEMWRPLRALSLLPPSRGIRNLLLLSDGHIQNTELTLKLLRDNAQHSRLFTCGLSPMANRHMLRALAQAGGGAYEFFDTKTKHNWAEKVACQLKRMASSGCSSVSVKWQQFSPTSPPLQAPKQLHALFNDCHTLVYGFVPHCTQATLLGNLRGQELKTMVSTSELQKTKGTFLHKLTARALIRDYEDGNLDTSEAEHEGKKAELKSFIIELSKEFSILSQFTSFVAIEERDSEQPQPGFTDIPKLIAEEDVDFLPYINWISPEDDEDLIEEESSEEDADCGFGLFDSCDSFTTPDFSPPAPHTTYFKEHASLYSISGHSAPPPPPPSMKRASDDVPHLSFSAPPAPPPHPFSMHHALADVPQCLISTPMGPSSGSLMERVSEVVPQPPQTLSSSLSSFRRDYPCNTSIDSFSSDSQAVGHINIPLPEIYRAQMGPISRNSLTLDSSRSSLPIHGYSSAMENQLHSALDSVSDEPEQSSSECVEGVSYMVPPAIENYGSELERGDFMSLKYKYRRTARHSSFSPVSCSFDFKVREQLPETSAPSDLEHQPEPHLQMPLFGQAGKTIELKSGVFPVKSYLPPKLYHLSTDGSLPDTAPAAVPSQLVVESDDTHEATSLSVARTPIGPSFGSAKFTSSGVHSKLGSSSSTYDGALGSTVVPVTSAPSDLEHQPKPGLCLKSLRRIRGTSCYLPPTLSNNDVPVGPRMAPEMAAQFHYRGFTPSYGLPKVEICSASQPHHEPEGPSSAPQLPVRASVLQRRPVPASFSAGHQNLPTNPFLHHQSAVLNAAESPEVLKLKWMKIFQMQHSEGYWELTTELGELINVNVDLFANVFLKDKGIHSLGVTAHADILRLVATLLVLQLMKANKLEEGKLLRTLFCLEEASQSRPERWEQVKKAVDWVCWADRQYPCVYSRLEFGLSWESATRQLLGYESLPPFSPLCGLDLQRTTAPVLVQ
ncbi:poly [ADP-ribose] polymerase 4 isoform X1 [Oreochromis niloticus]|uniref:poly [ADP-ribose] polymerase 4 isoform X1 n=1 Tax=Oreochromis niloticus TaxID=8128 RepID=UPI000673E566|nr:poly [ADP-ribose] polymerase 4 isoform X1 [Oreochromis niloticus]XP_013120858.1 poly [ADP-ribose] polymerase 4 isoform X1 [Oreochromis niloticus]XP_013120859.1 poly [ADP-ribose] polymerase 4 isoform X1 [Oreochromis niloticus]